MYTESFRYYTIIKCGKKKFSKKRASFNPLLAAGKGAKSARFKSDRLWNPNISGDLTPKLRSELYRDQLKTYPAQDYVILTRRLRGFFWFFLRSSAYSALALDPIRASRCPNEIVRVGGVIINRRSLSKGCPTSNKGLTKLFIPADFRIK